MTEKMVTAVVIASPKHLEGLIYWGRRIAAVQGGGLLVLVARAGDEKRLRALVERCVAEADAADAPRVEIRSAGGGDDLEFALGELHEHGVPQLLMGHLSDRHDDSSDAELMSRLFERAPCDTLVLRAGGDGELVAPSPESPPQMLVAAAGGANGAAALRMAGLLAEVSGVRVDSLFVEEPIGFDAEAIARRKARQMLEKAAGANAGKIRPRAIVADNFGEGLVRVLREQAYDLVIVGSSGRHRRGQTPFSILPKSLLAGAEDSGALVVPAIGVFRRRPPLSTRTAERARRLLERVVPQLDRSDRLRLVEGIQGSSVWDFDFVLLLSLSMVIASIGLLQNSGAVVIGAMLIAPLMTPLVGCGLALVHGNRLLVRHAVRSVVNGFLLAFGLSLVIGCARVLWAEMGQAPAFEATDQMLARGSPTLLDVIIALLSGFAGAYATARPNLLGALPGVAIAAALVPPIGSCGLAILAGNPRLAVGAAILFGTNIAAIVLGAAISLFALGIAPPRAEAARRWRWAGFGAVILLLATFGYVDWTLSIQDTRVRAAIISTLDDGKHLEDFFSRGRDKDGLEVFEVRVHTPEPVSGELTRRIQRAMSGRLGNTPIRVRVVSLLETEASSGS